MESGDINSSGYSSAETGGDGGGGGGVSGSYQDEEERPFFVNVKEKDEKDIIDAIIDVVFYYEDEREDLRKDPLVRLLIANLPGQYNFTIVTATSVIIEGAVA